jgi:hypothetical protein
LALAREPGHPDGQPGNAYDVIAPLAADGRIDPAQWNAHRSLARIIRYRPGEEPDIGHLVRRPGGSWAFRYDVLGDEDDEAGHHFNDHVFAPGEYVTITEDGVQHTYRIVSVSGP